MGTLMPSAALAAALHLVTGQLALTLVGALLTLALGS
jgi:hypothetical protein